MSDRDLIAELDRQAREREEAFFNRIAQRLGRPRLVEPPVQPIRGVPPFWQEYSLSREQNIELFMRNWEQMGGVAKQFPDKTSLASFIREEAARMQARRMLRADHPLLDELALDASVEVEMTVWRQSPEEEEQPSLLEIAASADIGLSVVDYAIAHTGTVVVTSSERQGRSISLLPAAYMAVIPAQAIKTRMGEVLAEISAAKTASLPAGIHFITGPSRSADIENDLTIGVHGPGMVYALILEEE